MRPVGEKVRVRVSVLKYCRNLSCTQYRITIFPHTIAQFSSQLFVILSYSETELEDLLTTYTKLNKNANVFLGGYHPERSSEESTNKPPSHDPGLSRRKETERHSWR